jgi:CBS domain-containing protein
MRIKDIMNSKPFFLYGDDPIIAASQQMKEARIRSLPVVDEENKLIGLITLREIIDSVLSATTKTSIKEAMITTPVSVVPDLPLKAAIKIMLTNRYGCLPVVSEDGTLIGFVAEVDFLKPLTDLAREANNSGIKMYVKDVMDLKPETLKETETVLEASAFMKEEKVRALAVLGWFGKLTGLLTQREVIEALLAENKKLLIKDAMLPAKQVITVLPETPIEEASEIMYTNRFNSLPVCNKGKTLLGFATETSLFRAMNKLVKVDDEFYAQRFGA